MEGQWDVFSIIVSIVSGIFGGLVTAILISLALSRKIERMHDEVKNELKRSNDVHIELIGALKELRASNEVVVKYLIENDGQHEIIVDRLKGGIAEISNRVELTEQRIINKVLEK